MKAVKSVNTVETASASLVIQRSTTPSQAATGVVWKSALCVWMIVVTYAAFMWAPPAHGFQNPSLARILFFHVPNSIVGSGVSFLSAWFAVRYLKTRSWLDDAKSKSFAGLALLFWILTTVTGAVFAKVQWGEYWSWDPKQSAIFILLLCYMAYFALRAGIADREKGALVAAAYTLFCAVIMPFLTYILPNSTPDTLHPRGVITTSSGMDYPYKMVFWSAVMGFIGLATWIYQLEMRVERIARLSDRLFEVRA